MGPFSFDTPSTPLALTLTLPVSFPPPPPPLLTALPPLRLGADAEAAGEVDDDVLPLPIEDEGESVNEFAK
jgi:hypothetical protein